ncbi:Serine/threonine-protein kinase STK11 [Trichinella pseudospiralis]|uniref:non-specific serine/threonine protein kinase n=1 Tax=Trichinella pseudospiralis TaxID=6337 RepID=A0A0V1G059_TRIPS|nr:Serine/threonine-protein kinase STK11 [Trichinella pseudospiralis]
MEDVQSDGSGRISFVRHDLHEFGLSPRTPVLQIVGGSRSSANASADESSDIFFDKWDQDYQEDEAVLDEFAVRRKQFMLDDSESVHWEHISCSVDHQGEEQDNSLNDATTDKDVLEEIVDSDGVKVVGDNERKNNADDSGDNEDCNFNEDYDKVTDRMTPDVDDDHHNEQSHEQHGLICLSGNDFINSNANNDNMNNISSNNNCNIVNDDCSVMMIGDELNLNFPRADSAELGFFDERKSRPKLVNKYLMGDVLGEGSYGKVKEALDTESLCRRAVKIFKKQRLKRIVNGEQDVANEVRLLRRLCHQNVVQVYDVIVDNEKQKLYLVLEYCVGSLQLMLDRSAQKRLPRWQAHQYFVQLLDGLDYLHGMGVVHKDIKPGNLLVTVGERLKISDFGVAEALSAYAGNDLISVARGTPKFQPPEIAQGCSSFHGFLVDVWSAGVTLYNLVSGQYPFHGDNVFILYENICSKQLQVPADCVDPLLESLLRGMLEKDPERRLSLRQVRRHEWVIKRPPLTLDKVSLPPYKDDILRKTTVFQYLQMLFEAELEEEEHRPNSTIYIQDTCSQSDPDNGIPQRLTHSGRAKSLSQSNKSSNDDSNKIIPSKRRFRFRTKLSNCGVQ